MSWWKKILIFVGIKITLLMLVLLFLAHKPVPEKIIYGMSFNTPYARELGLDWQKTYDAILDDLGVRHLRLAAHWPMVEPTRGQYNFTELDYQMDKAEEVGAKVILAVGRRLPRWPECHVPSWTNGLPTEVVRGAQLQYMRAVVERYRDRPTLIHWQVENEPFLRAFAYEQCGDLDVAFFESELAMVRELDTDTPILVTDSGNLGLWSDAYRRGDAFGTSVYVHFWNPELGQFRTFLPPFAYRIKENYMRLRYGDKPVYLIELSAEPWLIEPIVDVPLDIQFSRMDLAKFEDILAYAQGTRLQYQYLWGAEWWYWLKLRGEPALWERGQSLYVE